MSLEKVGLNLTGMSNPEPLNISINTTIEGFLNDMPRVANDITGGFFGLIILVFNTFYLYKTLSDTSRFGGFRYSKLRSVGISSGISSIMGLIMLNLGYFVNIYHVYIFVTLFFMIAIWLGKSE